MRIRMSMVMVNGRKVCFIVMIRTKVPEYNYSEAKKRWRVKYGSVLPVYVSPGL